MRLTDTVALLLASATLLGLVAHIVRQAYRRAHPKPRPPGALTTVEQGRRAP